ncbi:MAG: transporter substrate-binding domain-containing protein [Clostridia bacterium]|nr:transporter substrate-binding domain-containing protein [Clostridia bacterium]MBR2735660.1 transporter substrate-binding domain-containing protein [Clostridia bacterium]
MKAFINFLKTGIIFSIALLCFSGCKKIDEKPVLKVGMECSYAPFNWIQPNDHHGAVEVAPGWFACGYDVYMAKLIAENMGRNLQIVKIDWDGLLPALTSGKIDAIIAGMSATEDRKQSMDFTDNYYDSDIVIVVKKDGPYADAKSLEDFSGARITGQLSTVHYSLFIDQIPGVEKQVAMEDFSAMVSAVNAGKIDGYVSERPAAMVAAYTNPSLKYIEFEKGKGFSFSQDEVSIAIGVKKGNPIKEEINAALSKVDGETRMRLMETAVEYQPASAID